MGKNSKIKPSSGKPAGNGSSRNAGRSFQQEFGGDFAAALKAASEHLAQNYDDPAGIA